MASARKKSWLKRAGIALAVVAGLLLVALAIVMMRAEAWVRGRADDLAVEWSAALGRPVRIARIDLALLGGGDDVQIAGLRIGPSDQEPRGAPDALSIEHASMEIGLLRTLLSFGSRPHVEAITVRGLRVNVVRRPDGTLNWQDIARRARSREPQRPQQEPDERVQNTVIDLARLIDGAVAFVDLGPARGRASQARAARISAIDARVEHAGYERGVDLSVHAAALSDTRNLELRVRTSGVRERDGRRLPPALRELRLKLSPTELAPLAPFLAAAGEAGGSLREGTLGADLELARRPDGGRTTAEGMIGLTGARFQGGERFDARLALDASSDADRVRIDRAELTAGGMRLTARGTASAQGELRSLRDFELRGSGLSFDRIRALYPAFARRVQPAQLGGPFAITVDGAGSREAQQVSLSLDLTRASVVVPGGFRKPAGRPLSLRAELALAGAVGKPAAFRAELPRFEIEAGASDLRGSLRVADLTNPQIAIDARSRRLDLDELLPPRTERSTARKKPDREKPGVLARADGRIELRIGSGRMANVPFSDLVAELTLRDGRATARTLRVKAFGGSLSGSGSELPLFGSEGPVRVRGSIDGMQPQSLLARFAGAPELLRGAFAGSVDVTTAGMDLQDLRDTLTGRLEGRVAGAEFTPGSAFTALAERLQTLAAVPGLKQQLERSADRVAPAGGGWRLDDLAGALRFEKGAAIVQQPLVANTPQGRLSLQGRVSLSDAGRLTGTWELEPAALESLIGSELDLKQPLPIELRVEGPLTRPRFAFGNMTPLVERLARAYTETQVPDAARERIEEALEKTGIDLPGLGGRKRQDDRGAKTPGRSEDE